MKQLSIRLTNRDIDILRFINDFGFCEISHISERFNLKRPRNYQVVQRLVKNRFIQHERIFYGRPGIFRLTSEGGNLTELPPLNKMSLVGYDHNLQLIKVYLALTKKYPEADWISERQLKYDKFKDGVGKRGHICDGILILPEGKKIAIEVELSLKGERRLNSILKGYSAQFEFKEVWYFCSKNLVSSLQKTSAKLSFIKIFSMEDIL